VFRALKSAFGRWRDPSQLGLDLDGTPTDADTLLVRLRSLGLTRIARCQLTRNRNVMVSFRGDELRVHEGYLSAPRDVHRAIVLFIEGRTRNERRVARQRIVSFHVEAAPCSVAKRRERTRPEDEPIAAKLAALHDALNAEHFHGTLSSVPVRVSRRMQSRLGHYSAAAHGESAEIAISWRHLRRHGWNEVAHTLLHEMVHQWQDETGLEIDHGTRFRAKAREVGIEAAAKRLMSKR
jgi:hypothetical protein